jgi:pyridoxal 5'-phosphate synthase pdxT subunit
MPSCLLNHLPLQVILELLKNSSSAPINILAQLPIERLPALLPEFSADEATQAIVALRQGKHLFTTFHPELTKDDRFHEYFVRECVLLENV